MPTLKVKDAGREFVHQVEGDALTIGRAATNTIAIGDAKASKEHCRIEQVGDRWKLVDLESKNGTRVNGAFRNKAWLGDGDTIHIGTAQVRFGGGGAAPVARASQRTESGPRAARPPAAARDDGPEPPPRRKDRTQDQVLKYGLAALGTVLLLLLALWAGRRTRADEYNQEVLRIANRIADDGDWEKAIGYLEREGDSGRGGYYIIEQRINELRTGLPSLRLNQLERRAERIVSKLGLKIKAYHAGKQVSGDPDEIRRLVDRLKTDYAGTDMTRRAMEAWPAWFQGKVPQRGVDLLGSGRKMQRDWDETVQTADQYRKEWRFLEARETIEKFLTTREAVLDPDDLAYYRRQVKDRLQAINRMAESVYHGRESLARDLLRQKRYDQAIRAYRDVIEKFGIDLYLRKAQAAIAKIEELKKEGTGG